MGESILQRRVSRRFSTSKKLQRAMTARANHQTQGKTINPTGRNKKYKDTDGSADLPAPENLQKFKSAKLQQENPDQLVEHQGQLNKSQISKNNSVLNSDKDNANTIKRIETQVKFQKHLGQFFERIVPSKINFCLHSLKDFEQGNKAKESKEVKQMKEPRIIKFECGKNHNIALSETGIIYAWGDNNYGQI